MFFSKIFDDKESPQAVMGSTGFKSITPELFAWLEQEVTLKEIKQAIWSCDGSKALGSDGFTLAIL